MPHAAGTPSHSGRQRLLLLTAWNNAAKVSVSGANKTPAATAAAETAARTSPRRGVPNGTR